MRFLHTLLLVTLVAGGCFTLGCEMLSKSDDATSSTAAASHDKPGFKTIVEDGRLWVFREGSKELAEFEKHGEPAKMVTRIGAGPNGMTIRSDSADTIDAYLAAK